MRPSIAGVSEGNYREALQLLQHAEQDWQGLVREWLNVTLKNNTAAQIKWIDEISQWAAKNKSNLSAILFICLGRH